MPLFTFFKARYLAQVSFLAVLAGAAALTTPVQGQTQTVMGLDPIAPVQLSGSDEASQTFNETVLPSLTEIVNANLSERSAIGDLTAYALNPDELKLTVDSSVRAYFIGEGAGYRNTFGFYTGDSSDGLTGDAALIFPDASIGWGYSGSLDDRYLDVGDFVDLGAFEADDQLNLFLVANGANGGNLTYFTDDTMNPDLLVHYIMLATPESSYLLIGVEDLLYGGDQDFNDLVVALDIGQANLQALISQVVPLPGPLLAVFAALLAGVRARLKRRSKKTAREAVEGLIPA